MRGGWWGGGGWGCLSELYGILIRSFVTNNSSNVDLHNLQRYFFSFAGLIGVTRHILYLKPEVANLFDCPSLKL